MEPRGSEPPNILGRIQRRIDYAISFREFLEQGSSFYVTEGILEEYTAGLDHSDRDIAATLLYTTKDLMKKIEEHNCERKRLADLLAYKRKVIQLDESEKERYDKLKTDHPNIPRDYGLSNVNLDFLITGVVLAQGNNTALLSNDFGINEARKELLKMCEYHPFTLREFHKAYSGRFLED